MSVDTTTIKKIIFVNISVETGGPENIHLTCKAVSDLGIDASILYVDKSTLHKAKFLKYGNKIEQSILDDPSTLVVFPEGLDVSTYKNNRFQKAIYWLSLNDAAFCVQQNDIKKYIEDNNVAYNFCQCQYVIDYLTTFGVKNIIDISDYIDDEYILAKRNEKLVRSRVVLYNPLKGKEFTLKIISSNQDVMFVPLSNLNIDLMINIMDGSMVYIDFGTHPGKDRLPREAASRGLIVLTSKNGSACNKTDVPIPELCKIEANYSKLSIIRNILHTCLDNYEEEVKNFESYRQTIAGEKDKFLANIKAAFSS